MYLHQIRAAISGISYCPIHVQHRFSTVLIRQCTSHALCFIMYTFAFCSPFTNLSPSYVRRSHTIHSSFAVHSLIVCLASNHCSSGKIEHFRDCIRYSTGVTYMRLVTVRFRHFFIYSVKCRIVKMFIQNRFCGLDTDDQSRHRTMDIFTNVCTRRR